MPIDLFYSKIWFSLSVLSVSLTLQHVLISTPVKLRCLWKKNTPQTYIDYRVSVCVLKSFKTRESPSTGKYKFVNRRPHPLIKGFHHAVSPYKWVPPQERHGLKSQATKIRFHGFFRWTTTNKITAPKLLAVLRRIRLWLVDTFHKGLASNEEDLILVMTTSLPTSTWATADFIKRDLVPYTTDIYTSQL